MTYPQPARSQAPTTLLPGAARRRVAYVPPPQVAKQGNTIPALLITAGLVGTIGLVAFIAFSGPSAQSVEASHSHPENRNLTARGQLTVPDVQRILELRWRTKGNDKQMWLNNLAATVARYQWSLDHDNAGLLPKGKTAQAFTQQGARDLHAYAFHVKTAREHVDEAEHNELNLRDDDYVAKYLTDYTGNELLDLAEG